MRWHQQKKPLVAPLRIRRSIRWLIFLSASLALFTGLTSAVEAQNKPGLHPPTEVHRAYKIIKGHRVLVETHGDFFPKSNTSNSQVAASTPPKSNSTVAASATPDSNCPVVERSTDDATNSFQDPNTPTIKVIYAYASDQPNRFATYGPVIEAGDSALASYVAQEAGNSKSVRFDLGTINGPGCLDIQTIALPHTRAYYQAANTQTESTFTRLSSDVHNALGTQPASARNYLIYADNIVPAAGYGGEAEVPNDDSVAGTDEKLGDFNAIFYGRGGTDFYGSSTSYAPGTTSQVHLTLALHELSHSLGAVHNSAPNSSLKGHCIDDHDIMCSADGSRPMISPPPCQGVYSPPNKPAYDCNKNDYFNPAPAAGSYLATHWNLYNSVFMCPVQDCGAPDTTPPTVTIDSGPHAGSTLHGNQPSFSFSSPESRTTFECNWDNAAWQACSSPNHAPSPLANGSHSFSVRGSDRSHNVQTVPARSFTVDITKPGPQILSLNLVGGHGSFVGEYDSGASFNYSYSPSGLSVSCAFDDDPLASCPASSSSISDYDYLTEGAHTFHLQVTDPSNGELASSSRSFTVDTETPNTWFTSKVPKKIHKHSLKFYFASSKPSSSFTCQFDNKPKVHCASGYTQKKIKKGSHSFSVYAVDQAGNNSEPARAYFNVK